MGVKQTKPRWFSRNIPFVILVCVFSLVVGAGALEWRSVGRAHTQNTMFANAADGRDWPGYGRLYDEQHYSPLRAVNTETVSRLGLVWALDLPVTLSASTAPVEIDGVIYMSYGRSIVYAIDAVKGDVLWQYDPNAAEVAGDALKNGWNIRGVAYWDGVVLTGTLDGRLIALDAKTGRLLWSQQTFKPNEGRFITAAPRVFDGKVIIGHGGADVGQIRGYVTAYDVKTGRQLWRFYTVPGNPADGFESDAMRMAAETWTGEWWRYGGGGTVWNAITYDPKYDRIYIGTGNGQPWNQKIRSPQGGDNLFLSSIVALDAETGEYAWHYQTTPGESWDFNSCMDMTLAELNIGGEVRPVIMHAPKNGFFYVIDRENGALISAEKIATVTWAERVDLATGRPVETADARYSDGQTTIFPYPGGTHNWQPMSFNPQTGLVYIPVVDAAGTYDDRGIDPRTWRPEGRGNANPGVVPGLDFENPMAQGASLVAWDPVRQKQVWRVPIDDRTSAGTMTTAGGLVFQGRSNGELYAYDARTGEVLWRYDAGAGIVAQPITFERDGKQYISVVVGYGGAVASMGEASARFGWQYRDQPRRLLTFALDGAFRLPPTERVMAEPIRDPSFRFNRSLADHGLRVYGARCSGCHGRNAIAGGSAPDLRASPIVTDMESFDQVVRAGVLVSAGMPRFDELNNEDMRAIQHYVRARAHDNLARARDVTSTF